MSEQPGAAGNKNPIRAPHAAPLSEAIDALGTPRFGHALTRYSHALCCADYCFSFQVNQGVATPITVSESHESTTQRHIQSYAHGQLWRRDEALTTARAVATSHGAALVRMRPAEVRDARLRECVYPQLVDRVLICAADGPNHHLVSLLRWQPNRPFRPEEVERIEQHADHFASLVRKHIQLSVTQATADDALESAERIEQCLADSHALPLRERQVCARVILGMTSPEMGRELGISPDTVISYRRRVYVRLGVNDERELLLAYLQTYRDWRIGKSVGPVTSSG